MTRHANYHCFGSPLRLYYPLNIFTSPYHSLKFLLNFNNFYQKFEDHYNIDQNKKPKKVPKIITFLKN